MSIRSLAQSKFMKLPIRQLELRLIVKRVLRSDKQNEIKRTCKPIIKSMFDLFE